MKKSAITPFGFYLLLSSVSLLIMPWISISRIQGDYGFGVYTLVLRVCIALCFAWGAATSNLLFPKNFLQLNILIVLFLSLCWGMVNNEIDENQKAFLIQTFNLLFAYLAYSFGLSDQLAYDSSHLFSFYRKLAIPVLIVSAGAAIVSFSIFSAGESLGRYYSPIYQIGVSSAAFASINNVLGMAGCVLVALLSNKRGSLLMVLVVIAVCLMASFWRTKLAIAKRINPHKLLYFVLTLFILFFLAIVYSDVINEAATISFRRLPSFAASSDAIANLDLSGRDIEFNLALADLNSFYSFILGNGIGWNLSIPGRDIPVNAIHFSPLSLMIIYGPAGLLVFYLGLLSISASALRLVFSASGVISEPNILFASSYIIGAIAYSLTAYNLFIDPAVFVFAGILSARIKSLKALGSSRIAQEFSPS